LKVMLQEDLLASQHFKATHPQDFKNEKSKSHTKMLAIVREVLLPEIEKEVNTGELFIDLRQIYHSMILASWYKQRFREGFLGQLYVDQKRIKGINIADQNSHLKIYGQYLEALKKGVYSYIKEDYDSQSQQIVPRKYYSGGATMAIDRLLVILRPENQRLTARQKQLVRDLIGEQGVSPRDFKGLQIRLVELAAEEPLDLDHLTEIIQDVERLSFSDANGLLSRMRGRDDLGGDEAMLIADTDPDPAKVNIPISSGDLDTDPSRAFPYLANWFKEKRWFMEKEMEIIDIAEEDQFRIGEADDETSALGIIAVFRLRDAAQNVVEKRYFIPAYLSKDKNSDFNDNDTVELLLSEGDRRYLSLADQNAAFQRSLANYFRNSETRRTQKGQIRFTPQDELLVGVDTGTLSARPLDVSTSNVLTVLETNQGRLISKIYKDMRGATGDDDRIWPRNMEMERYAALASAEYPNIPRLRGVSYYRNARGEEFPLFLVMDAVNNEGEVGGVFWNSL
ncbi:MAG: hypothetical protein NUV91_04115, partial [Candidatus Omnitrophica bacterium]|nr:hypothetical protein [Candidatus Omnitrophota bacterium]